ncbi:MAG: F0F1 ATP synthase subunit delta [Methylophilaceae bacterium]|jgi:F-type H+-transporting ATPase subunit delta|nr:F0F1 ATP synthase subunit delta [Methylophilaceae bacterium]
MAEISTIARPYAVAIFNLAKEEKALSKWSDMLSLMSGIVENEDINSFINDSKILDEDREKLILNICGDKINSSGKNLIKLLVEYKRLLILSSITLLFEELKDKDEGVIEAEIIMAEQPDKKLVAKLLQSLEKRFNKKIEGKVVIDKSIVGGTKIVVGDTVIDASVRGQLDNLAYTLKA